MASFSEDTNGKSSSPRKSLRSIRSLSGRLEHSSTVTSADLFASYNASGTTHLDQSSAADLNASTRRASLSYDKSHTMDRLRSSFIADASPLQEPTDNNGNAPSHDASYDSVEDGLLHFESGKLTKRKTLRKKDGDFSSPSVGKRRPKNGWQMLQSALRQIPAIVLIGMFHLMIGIPFGVSYFPVGWRDDFSAGDGNSSDTNTGESQGEDFVHGPFPLPGKEALGIRMFLFSTIIGQIVFTLTSNFNNPIGLQMVENVPFTHSLCAIVIRHQGYGIEALATLFVMFGIASVVVGATFYYLGKYELGRIVYFFPTHVLVGCIGGIGLYIAKTGIEVTMDAAFLVEFFMEHWNLLRLTFLFEVLLRVLERVTLDANGKPRYTLLSPIYFCMITPLFYVGLFIFQYPVQQAREEGYFFPAISTAGGSDEGTTSIWEDILEDKGIFDMFKVLNFSAVSWSALFDSIPTLVALTLFSLIHVPINIPAFAISTNTDIDMNNELKAHGYSNIIAGICGGGLQNYMAYTQSVVYDRSGGYGKRSGMAVAILTSLLFFIGPTIASFIPRCMAGALLLHVGIDLFLEGVYDSYKKFDRLEYCGIWVIVICMTLYGMEAAMIAGVIAAVSTYAAQSITYLNPIRGSMSAVTLRSSHRNRNYKAAAVLDDPVDGRSRIVVIQLQGHLFFGNMAQLNSSIDNLLKVKHPTNISQQRRIVIMDFSLVFGIDSSAAQGLIKLKNAMHKYHVDVCVFVCGSDEGFPCEYNLSDELTTVPKHPHHNHHRSKDKKMNNGGKREDPEAVTEASSLLHGSSSEDDALTEEDHQYLLDFSGSFVLESLDLALIFAENTLIAWEDPLLLDDYKLTGGGVGEHLRWDFKWDAQTPSSVITDSILSPSRSTLILTGEENEKEVVILALSNLCVGRVIEKHEVELLFSKLNRESYRKDEFIWKQNDASNSAKLLISGMLVAVLENEADTSEIIFSGNLIGELGLVQGTTRLSSVKCISEEGAIVYSLSREAYEDLLRTAPQVARFIDLTCIQYLANRVQHVSNRIFETRCLPI